MTTSSNLYPFVSKSACKSLLDNSPLARHQAMVILFNLQTQYEQDTSTTRNKNKVGFMSSHAVHGTRIAKAILSGEALTVEDEARIETIAPRYSRQMACYLRTQAIADQPALKEIAALFSADQDA